jgi:hypothetical protein
MVKYARLNPQNRVQEVIELDDHVDPVSVHFEGYPLIKIKEDSQVRDGWVWDGHNLTPPQDSFLSLVHHAVRIRKDKQFIGCEVNGVLVESTQESISSILALREGMKEKHLPSTVMFKATTAYIHVNVEEVDEMLLKARQHFQKCFDMEVECIAKIRSREITTLVQVRNYMEKEMPEPRHLFLPRDDVGRMMPAPDWRNRKAEKADVSKREKKAQP